MTDQSSKLRVALYSGVFARYDAVSDSIRHKLRVLDRLAEMGDPVTAIVFTHYSEYQDPRVHPVGSVFEALKCPDFARVDVHVFEFGITYPLFDTVFLLRGRAPTVAIYHNLTPVDLVDDEPTRTALERSLVQKHNLACFDLVASVSEFNRDDLIAFGIPENRQSVLHLPPALEVSALSRPLEQRGSDGMVELLFVGRFVRAKGIADLVNAIERLAAWGVDGFRLTLAGSPKWSSAAVLSTLRHCQSCPELKERVRIIEAPDERQLGDLYRHADALVLPSYHEGYCVPVIEALSAGCHVIAYDAGNLPNVVDGLGSLIPTGDVDAFACAMKDWVGRVRRSRVDGRPLGHPTPNGDLEEAQWREKVRSHLSSHSEMSFEHGFLHLLGRATALRATGMPEWLKARLKRGEAA